MTILEAAEGEAKALKDWVTNAQVINFSKAIDPDRPESVAYELWGNLRVLRLIGISWKLRVENVDAGKKLWLPLSPGKKENFPFFVAEAEDGAPVFHVCLGTEVAMKSGGTYAPDLSIQTPDAEFTPAGVHVVFAWDFKHQDAENKPLDRGEVLEFSSLMRLVDPTADLKQRVFIDEDLPTRNAVLSNSEPSSLNDHHLEDLKVCEIARHRPGNKPLNRPVPK